MRGRRRLRRHHSHLCAGCDRHLRLWVGWGVGRHWPGRRRLVWERWLRLAGQRLGLLARTGGGGRRRGLARAQLEPFRIGRFLTRKRAESCAEWKLPTRGVEDRLPRCRRLNGRIDQPCLPKGRVGGQPRGGRLASRRPPSLRGITRTPSARCRAALGRRGVDQRNRWRRRVATITVAEHSSSEEDVSWNCRSS